jgi:hypothetical protein
MIPVYSSSPMGSIAAPNTPWRRISIACSAIWERTVSSSRCDGAMCPPMEPMSALMTESVIFMLSSCTAGVWISLGRRFSPRLDAAQQKVPVRPLIWISTPPITAGNMLSKTTDARLRRGVTENRSHKSRKQKWTFS